MVITIFNKKKRLFILSVLPPPSSLLPAVSSLPLLFHATELSSSGHQRPSNDISRTLSVLFPNHRYGSGIQDDEDRSWSGDDGCDEARAGDEVDRAGGAKVKADEDVPQRVVGLLKVIGKKGMWSNACEFLKLMIGLFSGIDITSF
ncbi:hypothetical protein ACFX15_023700 [Malus domestica]